MKVSFFGGLSIVEKPLQQPDRLPNPRIQLASFADLIATKMLLIQQRAEKKDYLDISEILKMRTLSEALFYAKQLYGKLFNPFLTFNTFAKNSTIEVSYYKSA